MVWFKTNILRSRLLTFPYCKISRGLSYNIFKLIKWFMFWLVVRFYFKILPRNTTTIQHKLYNMFISYSLQVIADQSLSYKGRNAPHCCKSYKSFKYALCFSLLVMILLINKKGFITVKLLHLLWGWITEVQGGDKW